MSTPEQPDTPPLTRRRLRDIRNTGATPIIDPEALTAVTLDDSSAPDEAQPAAESTPDSTPVAPPPFETSLAPVAPLARAAEPIVLPEPPGPDRGVDLGVAPLTRRQARQQERIRTASVPVITPDIAAAYAAEAADGHAATVEDPSSDAAVIEDTVLEDQVVEDAVVEDAVVEDAVVEDAVVEDGVAEDAVVEVDENPFEALGVTSGSVPIAVQGDEPAADEVAEAEHVEAAEEAASTRPDEHVDTPEESAEPVEELLSLDDAAATDSSARVVDPGFGAALLAGQVDPVQEFAPSFDELITRSGSGSVATPNALILSQSPDGGSIVSPVAATGEVIITGTLNLPEGLGSTGHAAGTADGKEVDAVLIDGELPAHSSPTPIAASAAISTVKTPGEIIKPPAPEKGGRLMLTLAITAGVLALALVGVLILAFATGVF